MPDPRIWPIARPAISRAGVGNVSAIVMASSPGRADADFTNTGKDRIWLARGETAVIGSGFPLNPNGGTYHIGTNNLYEGDIHAISSIADGETNLAMSEGMQK